MNMNIDDRYAPPRAEVLDLDRPPPGEWDGKYVRLRSPGSLPAHCVRCGGDDDASSPRRTITLRYTHPIHVLWLLLGPLPLLVASMLVTKRAKVGYLRCAPCDAVRRRWLAIAWTALAAAVLSAVMLVVEADGDAAHAYWVLVLALGLLAAIVGGIAQRPRMAIRKHRQGEFAIGSFAKAYRRRLQAEAERSREGARL